MFIFRAVRLATHNRAPTMDATTVTIGAMMGTSLFMLFALPIPMHWVPQIVSCLLFQAIGYLSYQGKLHPGKPALVYAVLHMMLFMARTLKKRMDHKKKLNHATDELILSYVQRMGRTQQADAPFPPSFSCPPSPGTIDSEHSSSDESPEVTVDIPPPATPASTDAPAPEEPWRLSRKRRPYRERPSSHAKKPPRQMDPEAQTTYVPPDGTPVLTY